MNTIINVFIALEILLDIAIFIWIVRLLTNGYSIRGALKSIVDKTANKLRRGELSTNTLMASFCFSLMLIGAVFSSMPRWVSISALLVLGVPTIYYVARKLLTSPCKD